MGLRWQSIYWPMAFVHGSVAVLPVSVPLRSLQQVERGELPLDALVSLLTPDSRLLGLYEEAVTYALGVREDIRHAQRLVGVALESMQRGDWDDAVAAADAAAWLEREHAGVARHWRHFQMLARWRASGVSSKHERPY